MMDYYRSRLLSFRNAFAGIGYVLRTQRNSWIHTVATFAVLGISSWLKLPITHWAILVLTISMVWTAEVINTSIETLIDLLHPQYHPVAKIGKDVSAGAVLIASIFSALVGILILGPPLVQKLWTLFVALQ